MHKDFIRIHRIPAMVMSITRVTARREVKVQSPSDSPDAIHKSGNIFHINTPT